MANAIAAELTRLRRRAPVQTIDPAGPLMKDPALAALPDPQRRGIRDAVKRVVWLSHAGDLEVVDAAVVSHSPVAPRTGLLVMVAALGGALAVGLCAVVGEALAAPRREDERVESLDVESLLESSNGGDAALALERWLAEDRSEEVS
jgi:hypothetical protein